MKLPPPDPARMCVFVTRRGDRFVDVVSERAVLTTLIESDEANERYVEQALAAGCPVFTTTVERDMWAAKIREQ